MPLRLRQFNNPRPDPNLLHTLDAVASRDLSTRIVSCFAELGVLLSRTAQDYQLWTSFEFSFFDVPDSLAGGSAMMPQKKNPYILEIVKSKAVAISGALMSCFSCVQKTPYSNSVETGSELHEFMVLSQRKAVDCAQLMRAFIDGVVPKEDKMLASVENSGSVATLVAEKYAKDNGVSYREAHRIIAQSVQNKATPGGFEQALRKAGMSTAKEWPQSLAYGGGPSPALVEEGIKQALEDLRLSAEWFRDEKHRWIKAEQERSGKIESLLTPN